jgi:hypothetical protein
MVEVTAPQKSAIPVVRGRAAAGSYLKRVWVQPGLPGAGEIGAAGSADGAWPPAPSRFARSARLISSSPSESSKAAVEPGAKAARRGPALAWALLLDVVLAGASDLGQLEP